MATAERSAAYVRLAWANPRTASLFQAFRVHHTLYFIFRRYYIYSFARVAACRVDRRAGDSNAFHSYAYAFIGVFISSAGNVADTRVFSL